MRTTRDVTVFTHIMGNTVPDNKKKKQPPTPTVKYGGHCLRYGHVLVGKNYLLLVYIMEDTAPDNIVRTRRVHGPRAWYCQRCSELQ